ncbi:tetratricopeptide repeat protein [Marinimicrobium locisalis]|uniref:tetratricopeptide repeat protein n=1 Tax=Marinimicrobium locisalis TaxID=546022 RepID=UPI003221FA68
MSLRYILLAIVVSLSACTQLEPLPEWVQTPTPQELDEILSGEALFDAPVSDDTPPDYPLFELTPQMRLVADEVAMQHRSAAARAQALHQRLLSSPMAGGLGMRYSALHTATAREAFEERQVNCLSFTLMYVAMARHMGLKAEVNDVKVPPSWDLRDNETFLLFRHVNAKVMLPFGDQLVIDLEMERYSPMYDQTVIEDQRVAAQFYNNRGMELIAEGQSRAGFLHLRKALSLDPQQGFVWNNLGTLYRGKGHLHKAETAYLQGLAQAPTDLTLMSNLSGLYQSAGEEEKAAYFYQRARAHRNGNPYYLYSLAQEQLAEGNLVEAERYVKAAMKQENQEPRFYTLAAEIYERRNLPDKAEAMREQAERWKGEVYL